MSCEQTFPDLASPWLEAGPLRMERASGRVTVRGRDVALTDKERDVLRLLLLQQGTPIGRAAILERLYPAVAPEARVVDVFICRLRAKLDRAGLCCVIGTVWRRGYVLQASRPESPLDRPVERSVTPPAGRMPAQDQPGSWAAMLRLV